MLITIGWNLRTFLFGLGLVLGSVGIALASFAIGACYIIKVSAKELIDRLW